MQVNLFSRHGLSFSIIIIYMLINDFQPLLLLPCLLAVATGAPQLLVGAGVGGQVSHQSVSKPLQGESRSTVQSKALGSGIASVSDSPNRLHGARRVVSAPVATPVFSSSPIVRASPFVGYTIYLALFLLLSFICTHVGEETGKGETLDLGPGDMYELGAHNLLQL